LLPSQNNRLHCRFLNFENKTAVEISKRMCGEAEGCAYDSNRFGWIDGRDPNDRERCRFCIQNLLVNWANRSPFII